MRSSFYLFSVKLSLIILLFFSDYSFANVDLPSTIRDCTERRQYELPVTNGICYGVIVIRGTEIIRNR